MCYLSLSTPSEDRHTVSWPASKMKLMWPSTILFVASHFISRKAQTPESHFQNQNWKAEYRAICLLLGHALPLSEKAFSQTAGRESHPMLDQQYSVLLRSLWPKQRPEVRKKQKGSSVVLVDGELYLWKGRHLLQGLEQKSDVPLPAPNSCVCMWLLKIIWRAWHETI